MMSPKILVIHQGALGDFILSLPALQTIKKAFPEGCFEMLGYPLTSDRIMTFEMWERRVHPDDLPRVLEAMDNARLERSFYAPQYRIMRGDNREIRWMEKSSPMPRNSGFTPIARIIRSSSM